MTEAVLPAPSSEVGTAFLGDEVVLFDRYRRSCHRLNGSAAAIWAHCDGSTARAEAVDALSAAFGADPAVVGADLDRLVGELDEHGLFATRPSTDGRPAEAGVPDAPVPDT